jgi:hypothetical protein
LRFVFNFDYFIAMGSSMDSGPCPTCGGIDVDLIQAPGMSGYFYRCNYCRGTFGSSRGQSSNPFQSGPQTWNQQSNYQSRQQPGYRTGSYSPYDGPPANGSGVYGSDPRNPDRFILLIAALFKLIRWILLKIYLLIRNRKNT